MCRSSREVLTKMAARLLEVFLKKTSSSCSILFTIFGQAYPSRVGSISAPSPSMYRGMPISFLLLLQSSFQTFQMVRLFSRACFSSEDSKSAIVSFSFRVCSPKGIMVPGVPSRETVETEVSIATWLITCRLRDWQQKKFFRERCIFREESFGKVNSKDVELFRNGSVHEFYHLKALITLEQVNTSVVSGCVMYAQ